MRRTIPLGCLVALVLAIAQPTMAAPPQHPEAATWEITCEGMEPFTVMSPWKVPGWEIGDVTPALYRGGEGTVYAQGTPVESFSTVPPPGLMPKLTACGMVGPLETLGEFHIVWNPAYFLFPGD